MTQKPQVLPPPVMWAESSTKIFVTICLEDCKDPEIKIQEKQIYFKGIGGTDKKEYEVTINLFKSIDPTPVIKNLKGRLIELVFNKKEAGPPFWKKLIEEDCKYHWLKCDFNKWNPENDSDSDSDDSKNRSFEKALGSLSRPHGAENGRLFDEYPDTIEGTDDSDDDEIPTLQSDKTE